MYSYSCTKCTHINYTDIATVLQTIQHINCTGIATALQTIHTLIVQV